MPTAGNGSLSFPLSWFKTTRNGDLTSENKKKKRLMLPHQ
jgi:hypothetical protein